MRLIVEGRVVAGAHRAYFAWGQSSLHHHTKNVRYGKGDLVHTPVRSTRAGRALLRQQVLLQE